MLLFTLSECSLKETEAKHAKHAVAKGTADIPRLTTHTAGQAAKQYITTHANAAHNCAFAFALSSHELCCATCAAQPMLVGCIFRG